jgi:hypothetical protein
VVKCAEWGIWRDFGSALPFQIRLIQTKPVLPLSNEHGSQVKDQGRQHCCHNKHKIFPISLHVMYIYFPGTPRPIAVIRAITVIRDDDPDLPKRGAALIKVMLSTPSRVLR